MNRNNGTKSKLLWHSNAPYAPTGCSGLTDSHGIIVPSTKAPRRHSHVPGHGPRRTHSMSTAKRTRGPYRLKGSKTSYEERLARRQEPRPTCRCGCGQLVEWDTSRCHWYRYAAGHFHLPWHHGESWLREQYITERRTTEEIAAECGVTRSTVRRKLHALGVPLRDRSESRIGRMVGEKNPSWKGGVADWEYAAGWKVIARKIRDRDEWTCQDCDEQRKRWGHSLHVHHIDGDKLNNDPANLVSLCVSCHRAAHQEEVMP